MRRADLRLVTSAPLPYLLSIPRSAAPAAGAWPLLCFLHGYDGGAPLPIQQALTRHGPLAAASAPTATAEFIIVAAQLPTRGDVWYRFADAVQEIVRQVRARHRADPEQTFLTGFSFGGNGVFDLALAQRECWAALWPVDPTRVPRADPERPVWLSSGAVSRRDAHAFIRRLHLGPLHDVELGDRVYVDQGQDHVGTARLAYQDARIYRWLLSKRLSKPCA
jgi:predicted peptidase